MSTNFGFQEFSPWPGGGDGSASFELIDHVEQVDLSDEALIRAADGYAIMMLDDARPLPHTTEELESATRAVIAALRARNHRDASSLATLREPWRAAADWDAYEDRFGETFPADDGGSGWTRNPEEA
jgi:hypothetical protein